MTLCLINPPTAGATHHKLETNGSLPEKMSGPAPYQEFTQSHQRRYRDVVISPITPQKMWQNILADLRQQMTVLTYNNWLADSVPLLTACTPTFLMVLVRNAYAQEWLTGTLHSVVHRSLHTIGNERLTENPS